MAKYDLVVLVEVLGGKWRSPQWPSTGTLASMAKYDLVVLVEVLGGKWCSPQWPSTETLASMANPPYYT
jgi:hypothetical protein